MPRSVSSFSFVKTSYSHPEQLADTQQENLPSTALCLTEGGDERIALDPMSGLNAYGCRPFPDPEILAYGSSTASIISMESYRHADRLRMRLQEAAVNASQAAVYSREIGRIRTELLQLCDLPDTTGMIISPSGTDIHALAAHYSGSGEAIPPLIVMIETNETGKGVAAALKGTGDTENASRTHELAPVPVRLGDGTPRPLTDIDKEVELLVSGALASDRRVLLILIDQSKTGLIAPSLDCVLSLHHRFQNKIDVLVDACQFRVAPPALRAYLEQSFMIALTGSKFLTGPSFSGALLVPQALLRRLQSVQLPANSPASANWPSSPAMMTKNVKQTVNFGLLLRWEAALQELKAFRSVPQATIINILQDFAYAVQQRLDKDPLIEPLAVPRLNRRPLTAENSWDHLQTIFPFLLVHADAGRTYLSAEETLHVYRQLSVDQAFNPEHPDAQLAAMRCQLGQPVACGKRNGTAVSALRLCISARLIVQAAADGDKGAAVIAAAMAVLDKTGLLIRSLPKI
jgi:hypothetical protein